MKIRFAIYLICFLSILAHAQKTKTPGQQWFESFRRQGKEWQEERKKRDCVDSIIQKDIAVYDTTTDYHRKWRALRRLGEVSCGKTQDFLLQTAISDTSMEFRMLALRYLVWVDAKNAIPALLERVHEDISDEEKLRIGRTIMLLEDERAVPVINEVCYRSEDPKILNECLSNCYDDVPRKESIRYYTFRLRNAKDEREQVNAACCLAMKRTSRRSVSHRNRCGEWPFDPPQMSGLGTVADGFSPSPGSSAFGKV